MKFRSMGNGAAAGIQHNDAKRVFAWLWHAWLEAQSQVPLLRWLGLAAAACASLAVYLAVAEGRTGLEMTVYAMVTLLFVLAVPAIFYLLFEVYRKHRSDAIFDSHRLAGLIHRIAREEIEARAEADLAQENRVLMLLPDHAKRK
jgi:hypothetical protein